MGRYFCLSLASPARRPVFLPAEAGLRRPGGRPELRHGHHKRPRLNLLRLGEDLSLAHLRLADVLIEHLPWHDCIARYDRPHTLFYCDPPYWQTEGYGVDFPLDQYQRLADAARSIAGTLIISVNDHPDMRQVFAGLPVREVPITYTVGGTGSSAEVAELVIGNWKGGCTAAAHRPARPGHGLLTVTPLRRPQNGSE